MSDLLRRRRGDSAQEERERWITHRTGQLVEEGRDWMSALAIATHEAELRAGGGARPRAPRGSGRRGAAPGRAQLTDALPGRPRDAAAPVLEVIEHEDGRVTLRVLPRD